MLRSLAAAAFAASCLCAPLGLQAQQESGVKPGDQVTTDFFTASGQQIGAIEGTRLVDGAGNVFMPFVGTVHVQGLNAEGIRVLLVQKFGPFYTDPVVTVKVLLRVNITGVVGTPGHYFLDPTTTIMDALALAGGIGSDLAGGGGGGEASDPAKVRLVREGQTRILDLRPETVGAATTDMLIQSGDWIHVPARPRSRFRDEIQFWGSLLSLVAAVTVLVQGR